MAEVFKNSVLFRWIGKLLLLLRQWWDTSFLHGCSRVLHQYGYDSQTRQIWLRWGRVENAANNSHFVALIRKLRVFWQGLGEILQQSLCFRIFITIKCFYLHLSKNSLVLRQINRLQPRQWLLAAFCCYLPIEYLIRDTLKIAFLSSVWEELFLILAVLLVIWRVMLKQDGKTVRITVLDAWLLLFFAVGFFLMSVNRPYPEVALPGYRIVVQYMLWYFLILRLLDGDQDIRVMWFTFVALLALVSLHGIWQYAVGVDIPETWVSHTEMGVRTRVFSLTGSPNILGSLLVMLAPLAAAGVYYCRQTWCKLLALGLVACSMLCLLFTFSRGAWLGMMLAVLIFSLFIDKRLTFLMGGAIAGILICVPSITSRITFLFTDDYAVASAIGGRSLRWATGKLLLSENNPFLGFGLGRFGGAVAMQNQLLDKTDTFSYFYMDNYYLKTLVEMGWLGLIAYLCLLIALLYIGIKAIQNSDVSFSDLPGDPLVRGIGNKRILAIAIFSAICGVLLHCYFENIFEEPFMSSYFWGLAALLVYLGFFRSEPPDSTQTPLSAERNAKVCASHQKHE